MTRLAALLGLCLWFVCSLGFAQQRAIPHAQDRPPNDPRSPEEAVKMMTVPPGFQVELVAAEPEIVNPVAMTIDERGRFWITESLEYPRHAPGPGKDRVKILEDTDGDGRADKFTVFLDGLNIPSGIAVGHGGVWVANAPDLLFVQDTDGDGVADKQEVVVTGFGRDDTHELPNSLTWGPDGWLYGLNGVFNPSHVKYAPTNPNFRPEHEGWKFTCALFRIHPRTRKFELFCEGTSNPWGVAFNDDGEAFVSACVIDHLWHLTQTGYYHRQGGPYPPHTWKLESIVKHKHQKAAYCGITWFDSDAYPEEYRRKLYMGNIHGGCINVDRIERDGSTYKGFGEPDFLTANDAWFMPVVQKTGADGCLYILDWYDRYHCYQDANRDPEGIDRLRGRLYRVRYVGESDVTPPRRTPPVDLAKLTSPELIALLGHPNVWKRETAQRILQERNQWEVRDQLEESLTNPQDPTPRLQVQHMLFTLSGLNPTAVGNSRSRTSVCWQLLAHPDPVRRVWGVRYFGSHAYPEFDTGDIQGDGAFLRQALRDPHAAVRRQAAIVAGLHSHDTLQWTTLGGELAEAVVAEPNDSLLANIVFQAIKNLGNSETGIDERSRFSDAFALLQTSALWDSPRGQELLRRTAAWLIAQRKMNYEQLGVTLKADERNLQLWLPALAQQVRTGELKGDDLRQLRTMIEPILKPYLAKSATDGIPLEAAWLAVHWQQPEALRIVKLVLEDGNAPADRVASSFEALVAAKDSAVIPIFERLVQSKPLPVEIRGRLIDALSALDEGRLADRLLSSYPQLEQPLQVKVIELLTQRPTWAKALFQKVINKELPATVINLTQARRMRDSGDAELIKLVADVWGAIRETRNPDREQIVVNMRRHLATVKGDPFAGERVFKKICAQCHKIYGEGQEVGPDITLNGRNNFDQLLSNVFDPSLVIGAGYRALTVVTNNGKVINGLAVEQSDRRVVLKVQGGKQEIIPRDEIDELKISELSLMPEQLEKQISPLEIADLFAYLVLDKPPSDSTGRRLSGSDLIPPRASVDPEPSVQIFQTVAPGFTTVTSGEGGVALLPQHAGDSAVVRTHPVEKDQPSIATGKFELPADKDCRLRLRVSHHPQGDWRLAVRVDGQRVFEQDVSAATCPDGWLTTTIDLNRFAGKTVVIDLLNEPTGWSYEFAFWGFVRLQTTDRAP